MKNNDFSSLGVSPALVRVLHQCGYQQPTPIQQQAIPQLLQARDLLGIAQTGTGKTAAFALPVIQTLLGSGQRPRPRCPRALILAPTRELAAQIRAEIDKLAHGTGLSHACVFGGVGANPQIRALAKGVDVLVATPGRLLDLCRERHVDLSGVAHLVLDEADRLLDMGFIRDVRRIVERTPTDRQTLLFSATMPREVAELAGEILRDPVRVDVSPKQVTVASIEQRVVNVATADKQRALEQLLRDRAVTRAIVFTRTKHGANRVAKKLLQSGIGAEAIHGNKSQNARERALESFRSGDAWVLVATDIAARGIDISGISHVINFELPHEPESYVHRIGRTARAGAQGVAWSLVDPSERGRLKAVEKLTRSRTEELVVKLPRREVPSDGQGTERAAIPAPEPRQEPAEEQRGRTGRRRRPRRPRRQRAA